MILKQSVINTFQRINLSYLFYLSLGDDKVNEVANWLTSATCQTTALVKACILWVYSETMKMEAGKSKTRLDDFDRVRYFILEADKDAYYTCID